MIGFSRYKITRGSIYFKGRDITGATIDERARLGVGISFQRPPTIKGVTLRSLISFGSPNLSREEIEKTAAKLDAKEFPRPRDKRRALRRRDEAHGDASDNSPVAGGFVCLDEPESGVDLENMALIGKAARIALGRDSFDGAACRRSIKSRRADYKSGLIITHTGQIMDHLYVDRGHVLMNGEIVCSGNALELLGEIRSHGYTECFRCAGCERSEG